MLLTWLFVIHQRRTPAPIIPLQLFADAAVRRLGLLAVLTGLVMFVLLFYAPLLLQGGFALSPNDAGMLVTPLLVSLTVGSVVNGRMILRVERPERLFSFGVLLLVAGVGMLCGVAADTSRHLLMAILALCGLSLGFQLPNLTLQMQSAVGKEYQGAASALIQTLRTLGSMFGASLAGLLVSLGFNREVARTLTQEGIQDVRVWRLFESPQLLLRAADQEILASLGQLQGFDTASLLAQARLGLITGIRGAFVGCLLVALISYFVSRRLPPFARRNQSH